ncbi:hypothetical protein ACE6H2_021346 [Prunus campanulata]
MCDLLRINTDRGVMIGDGKQRFSKNGTPINHFLGTSTFSEYTVIHEGCLAKIDSSAPLDKVCILSCGVSTGCLAKINRLAPLDKVCILSCGISTGLGATLNVAKPKKGSSVAVFGLEAVGLAVIAEMTNGGVDRSIEYTGNINAMISAFECVHDGWGVAVLVGVPNKDAVFMTKPINVLNERTLKGTFFGNYKPSTDLPSVVDMYMNKELKVNLLCAITRTIYENCL